MSYSKNRSSGEQFRREQIVLMQFKSHQTSHNATGCDSSTLATLEKSIINPELEPPVPSAQRQELGFQP